MRVILATYLGTKIRRTAVFRSAPENSSRDLISKITRVLKMEKRCIKEQYRGCEFNYGIL
jgi:hypothetical protein